MKPPLTEAEKVANALQLEGHIEGGFFRRTFQADHRDLLATENGDRFLMTSIFYMLTAPSPVGHWHLNRSDIMHYYHLGDPIRYHLIHSDGRYESLILGGDVLAGQQLQLRALGGTWKSSELIIGDAGYGLISEAVAPGFDYHDMTLGKRHTLLKRFPQHADVIERFSKEP